MSIRQSFTVVCDCCGAATDPARTIAHARADAWDAGYVISPPPTEGDYMGDLCRRCASVTHDPYENKCGGRSRPAVDDKRPF